jgi:hypothetical protein
VIFAHLLTVLLVGSIASANENCRSHQLNWFLLNVTATFSDHGTIPGIQFSSRDTESDSSPRPYLLTHLEYQGQDGSVIALSPATIDDKEPWQHRVRWAERFLKKWEAEGRPLTDALAEPGSFETEESIQALVKNYDSLPSFKLEAGEYYESVALKFGDQLSARKWRLVPSDSSVKTFSWRYNEQLMFPIPTEGQRPDDVRVPDSLTYISDILIHKGRPYFIEKTATFALNPNFVSETGWLLSSRRCGSSAALAFFDEAKEFFVLAVLPLIGVLWLLYLVVRLCWSTWKRRAPH